MKKLAEKFEKVMMAVSFAEAGEHETAREIMREKVKEDRPSAQIRPQKRPRKTLRT